MTPLPPPPRSLLDHASLFLDFDGTLVDFNLDPAAVQVGEALRSLLRDLDHQLDRRLAILTGRGLDEATERLGLGAIAMAGSHGLERRDTEGRVTRGAIPVGVTKAEAAARRFAEQHKLLLEVKPAGIALHYRDSTHAEQSVDEFATKLAAVTGLELQSGKCVRELKAPGADKGDAVRAFMAEPPFTLGRPVVVGDDLTDEHAFVAAAALGGCGILVGPPRPTAAAWTLPDVAAALAWLGGRS